MRTLLALKQSNTDMIEKLILSAFSPGDDVICVSDQQDLLGTIISRPPDILLYNRFFPGNVSPQDAIRAIRRSSPRTRIIFVVGQLDENAWADCAAARVIGIKDIVCWEKGTALQGSQLLNAVRQMITSPRRDIDNDGLDRMLESVMGIRIRRPRVYVYGPINRNLPSDIDRVDLPNDADLIIAVGDPEEAAEFFASLDCTVPIVMVSDFDDGEVKSLVKSNVAAIRPEMLDDFLKEFFFAGDGSAPSSAPSPVKEAVQAAKTGGSIKAKFLGLLKKWGKWKSGKDSKAKPSPKTYLGGLGKKKPGGDPVVNEDTAVTKVSGQEYFEQRASRGAAPDLLRREDNPRDSELARQTGQTSRKAEWRESTVSEKARPEAPEHRVQGERKEPAVPEGFVALGRVPGVSSSLDSVEAIVAAKPRAILVSGTKWIKDLRRKRSLQAVPIVVVGDNHDPSLCVAAGADECVSTLDQQAVDLILARVERKKATWARAERDPLTGCFNRGFLNAYLAEECRPVSVLMLDLDHFKVVNDTYGHEAGDQVLRQFVPFLCSTVRETDIVARYGGEEFVVLLPGANIEQAAQVAEKICAGWREQVIETGSGRVYSTVSIGVAGPGPNGLKNADKAVYAAKGTEEAGRDRWVRFDRMPDHGGRANPGCHEASVGQSREVNHGRYPPGQRDQEKAPNVAKRAGRNRVVTAGNVEPVDIVDKVAALGEFTLVALLKQDSFIGYTVIDARGPFAGQLAGEVVELTVADGASVYPGSHWLFGLSSETLVIKQGGKAALVGKRGRFKKNEVQKVAQYVEGVL